MFVLDLMTEDLRSVSVSAVQLMMLLMGSEETPSGSPFDRVYLVGRRPSQ